MSTDVLTQNVLYVAAITLLNKEEYVCSVMQLQIFTKKYVLCVEMESSPPLSRNVRIVM